MDYAFHSTRRTDTVESSIMQCVRRRQNRCIIGEFHYQNSAPYRRPSDGHSIVTFIFVIKDLFIMSTSSADASFPAASCAIFQNFICNIFIYYNKGYILLHIITYYIYYILSLFAAAPFKRRAQADGQAVTGRRGWVVRLVYRPRLPMRLGLGVGHQLAIDLSPTCRFLTFLTFF